MLNGEQKNQILAILFAATEPVTLEELQYIFEGQDQEAVSGIVGTLAAEFNTLQDAMEIRNVGGGYRITTRPRHHDVIRTYLKTKPPAKLSPAALETLAVIAYRQPITLPEIMEIRGIKGTTTIKTLLERRLIEVRGRKRVVGKPILYGTTREFLVQFGLSDLSELPTLEEFEEVFGQES